MRRKLISVVATAFALGTLVGAPVASAAHDGDSLTLFGKITDFDKTDNGDEGMSEGDEISFAYDLYEDRHSEAGDGDGTCEVVEFDAGDGEGEGHGHDGYSASNNHGHDDVSFEADCAAVFNTDDGGIDVEGTVTDSDFEDKKVELDIVGGSGDFDDAGGVAVIEFFDHHRSHSAQHAGDDHGGGADDDDDAHEDGSEHKAPVFKVTFDFS